MGKVIVALLSALWLAPASGRGDEPLPVTGSSADLVRGRFAAGVEGGAPDPVTWQRALAAVRDGDYRAAIDRFDLAAAEIRDHAAACDPRRRDCEQRLPRARARALIRKATLAAEDARVLLVIEHEIDKQVAHGGGGMMLVETTLRAAQAARRLFLLDRAIRGGNDPALRERAARFFRPLADATAPEARAFGRLGLATLLADAGEHHAARLALAAIPPADLRPEAVDLLAHLHAELGEPDRAFEAIAAARDALPDWPEVAAGLRVSNDLDALRLDPRFARLLEGPGTGD